MQHVLMFLLDILYWNASHIDVDPMLVAWGTSIPIVFCWWDMLVGLFPKEILTCYIFSWSNKSHVSEKKTQQDQGCQSSFWTIGKLAEDT